MRWERWKRIFGVLSSAYCQGWTYFFSLVLALQVPAVHPCPIIFFWLSLFSQTTSFWEEGYRLIQVETDSLVSIQKLHNGWAWGSTFQYYPENQRANEKGLEVWIETYLEGRQCEDVLAKQSIGPAPGLTILRDPLLQSDSGKRMIT